MCIRDRSEGPNAESVFIAGMFVKYGKDYVKICRHKGLCDEADTAQKAIKQMEKTLLTLVKQRTAG